MQRLCVNHRLLGPRTWTRLTAPETRNRGDSHACVIAGAAGRLCSALVGILISVLLAGSTWGETKNAGVEQIWDWIASTRWLKTRAMSACRSHCALEGFRLDKSEYRADNALRSAASGSITAKVPPSVSGPFFVGFIFYDSAGREVVGVDVRGERRGVAVANDNDNNQHLFYLTDAVELRPGDEIQLRALSAEGAYRTEDLVLLREKPVARPPHMNFVNGRHGEPPDLDHDLVHRLHRGISNRVTTP